MFRNSSVNWPGNEEIKMRVTGGLSSPLEDWCDGRRDIRVAERETMAPASMEFSSMIVITVYYVYSPFLEQND